MLRLEEANTRKASSSLKTPMASKSTNTIKFLCSYGGKILPRYPDGKLRYNGGQTRVLAVNRSISYSELVAKLSELCGVNVCFIRCQLPTEDLDALVSITCDEDLLNLLEEYDRQAKMLKIRVFLSLPKSSSSSSSSSSTVTHEAGSPKPPMYHVAKPRVQVKNRSVGKVTCDVYGNPSWSYLVHNGNYWQ